MIEMIIDTLMKKKNNLKHPININNINKIQYFFQSTTTVSTPMTPSTPMIPLDIQLPPQMVTKMNKPYKYRE
jgi:hypothetical protein